MPEVICNTCSGTGWVPDGNCPACGGTGKVPLAVRKKPRTWWQNHRATIYMAILCFFIIFRYINYPEFRPVVHWAIIILFSAIVAFTLVFCPVLVFVTICAGILAAADFWEAIKRCFR